MKRIQKVIGIILVIMLISVQLIPIINVSAEETETFKITTYGENSDGIRTDLVTNTAALTVNNVSNGDEFTAYKILDAYYNETSNEVTYEFTSDFQAFLDQSTNETYKNMTVEDYYGLTSDYIYINGIPGASTSVITTSTLNVLVSNYTTYIRSNDTITGIDMTTTGSSANVTVISGSYLVLPKTIVTLEREADMDTLEIVRNLYGVMVGNVVFTAGDTGWELNDCVIYAKREENYNRPFITTFNSTDFLSGSLTEEDMEIFYLEFSSIFGKKHMFVADFGVPDLPTNAINRAFQVEIEFPEGITYDSENIYSVGESLERIIDGKILNDLGVEAGTITFNEQKVIISIDFELYHYDYFSFSTDIELNDKATVGDMGNEIITRVTATDDPYVEGSTITLENSVIMTTYGLELTSYGEADADGTKPLLTGAKYEIYTNSELTEDSKIGDFTVGEDGTATFTGVPAGVVYLKQVTAPTGYQLIKETIAVSITGENSSDLDNDSYYEITTTNTAMWYLPTTGGIGTIIYTVMGLLVIGIASYVLINYHKKSIKISN